MLEHDTYEVVQREHEKVPSNLLTGHTQENDGSKDTDGRSDRR